MKQAIVPIDKGRTMPYYGFNFLWLFIWRPAAAVFTRR